MLQKQELAEEGLWIKTRESLMEGFQEVLKDPASSVYLVAQSEARLCGLQERAEADARWKAMAMMRALSVGGDLWGTVDAVGRAGESWAEIGPVVFKEWLFLIERASRRPNPFEASGADAQKMLRWARPEVWLRNALTVSQAGWVSYGSQGPQSVCERSPLGDAEQQEMARVYLKMREATIKSERNLTSRGGLSSLRLMFPLIYWQNEAEASSYFESVVQRAQLDAETPHGVKRGAGHRM